MIAWSRRTVTGVSIACLIIALATMGGYRLRTSAGSGPGHVKLAISTYDQAFVSRSGLDYNAATHGCIFYAYPCASFDGALSATSSGGVIDVLESGNYAGVTITKAVTIDGTGAGASVAGVNPTITVQAGPNDVVILRHLRLEGGEFAASDGIRFLSGKALILDDVTIEEYTQHGVSVELTTPGSLTIINSRIQDNALAGVAITPSGATAQVTISHSQISRNYYGVIAQDGADVSLTDSLVSGSTSIGVGCQTYGSGPCTIQTAHDRIDHNGAALWMNHASGNAQITETLSDNDLTSNTYGIYGDSGGTLSAASAGNNRFVNNAVNGTVTGSVTQM